MKILTFDIEDWWGYDYYKLGDRSDWEPRLDKYLRVVFIGWKRNQSDFLYFGRSGCLKSGCR